MMSASVLTFAMFLAIFTLLTLVIVGLATRRIEHVNLLIAALIVAAVVLEWLHSVVGS